jgi:hypothetical protein
MIRWEYLTLTWRQWVSEDTNDWVSEAYVQHPDGTYKHVAEKALASESRFRIPLAMSDLGREGWEALNVHVNNAAQLIKGTGSATHYVAEPMNITIFFKRPAED